MVRLRPAFRRWRGFVLPLAAAVLAIVLGVISSQATPSAAATKYSAAVGGGRAGISVDAFRPSVIFVAQGDSIEWTNPYEEIHTVTYVPGTAGKSGFAVAEQVPFIIDAGPKPLPGVAPPPGPPKLAVNPQVSTPAPASGAASVDGTAYANSGILFKGQGWTATFPRQGAFRFLCIVHPFMEVNVQVLAPGTTVPSQAMIDADAAGQLASQLAKGEASAAATRPGAREVTQAPSVEFTSVNRFIPSRIQVGVGDSVTWRNTTQVPHTITFNAPAGISFALPEPQPSGPPLLTIDPKVLFPVVPSRNFDGSGYVNSGFITADAELATAGTTFSLTFTKAGTYSYICVLHADQGMAGVVEVGAPTIRPPSTGDGGLAGQGDIASLYYYAAGALLALAGVAAIGARVRA